MSNFVVYFLYLFIHRLFSKLNASNYIKNPVKSPWHEKLISMSLGILNDRTG